MITVPTQLEKSTIGAPSRHFKASSCFCGCCWSSGLPLLFALGQKQRGSTLGVPSNEAWEANLFAQGSPSVTPVQLPPMPLQLVSIERRNKPEASIQFSIDQFVIQHTPPPPQELPLPGRLACPVPVSSPPPGLGFAPCDSEEGNGRSSTGSIDIDSASTHGCASEDDDILGPLSPAPADERGGGFPVGEQFPRTRHYPRHHCPVTSAHKVVLEETEVRPGGSMPRCQSRCCYTGSSTQRIDGRVRRGTGVQASPTFGTTLWARGARGTPRPPESVSEEPLPPEVESVSEEPIPPDVRI